MEFSAKQIAEFVGGKVEGDELATVNSFAKIEEGKKGALAGLIRNKMNNNKSLEQIADDLDVPVDQIRPIYEELAKEMKKF